jgi:pseudouridine-5'-phosphate glycosidase
VPVIGFGTSEFPAFYSRRSDLPVDARVDSPAAVAAIIRASRSLRDCAGVGLTGGTLVTVPVPSEHELPPERLEPIISALLDEARAQGIEGAASTPYLLSRIAEETGGASLRANVALLENNAAVAAEIALALKGKAREP